ncbi:hypothetical protein SRHO_G00118240 [Serrasalmus rhombeus]
MEEAVLITEAVAEQLQLGNVHSAPQESLAVCEHACQRCQGQEELCFNKRKRADGTQSKASHSFSSSRLGEEERRRILWYCLLKRVRNSFRVLDCGPPAAEVVRRDERLILSSPAPPLLGEKLADRWARAIQQWEWDLDKWLI